jgi:hypothetical protein
LIVIASYRCLIHFNLNRFNVAAETGSAIAGVRMSTIPGQTIERNRDIPTVGSRYVPRRRTTPTTKSTSDRLPILTIVNAKAISLEDASKGYAQFDKGIAAKFVPDPHGLLMKAA